MQRISISKIIKVNSKYFNIFETIEFLAEREKIALLGTLAAL